VTTATPTTPWLRRATPLLLLAGVILLVALLTGPGGAAPPLDPRSTAPDGTKALVDSLRALGARVDVGATTIADGVDVVLLLTDDLDEDSADDLRAWLATGGRLVVADPFSELVPDAVGSASVAGFAEAPISRDCELPALAEVAEVLPASGSVVYATPVGATGCFPRADGHWLVASAFGEGAVVAIGGPDVLMNGRLDAAAHPELLAALLVPTGQEHVALLRPADREKATRRCSTSSVTTSGCSPCSSRSRS
jgi:hypothetical protein